MHKIVLLDKKHAILQATMQLVSENGFHATPMSLVAKKANVAAGTIYHYFENKEQLINELYNHLIQKRDDALLNKDDINKNYKERFFNFWFGLYEFSIQNPPEFLFLEQYANSPYIHQTSKDQSDQHFKSITQFLQQGIKSGVLREINLSLMAALMHGSVASTVKLAIAKESTLSKTMLQSAAQSCWDGLKIT